MSAEQSNWHYVRDGKPLGPFVGSALTAADIQPDTLVWQKGMSEWARASDTPLGDLVFGIPPRVEVIPPPILPGPPAQQVAAAPVPEPSPALEVPCEPEIERNYFARHWRGDLSLARSYWVNVILLGAAANIAVTAFYGVADLSVKNTAVAFFPLIGFLFSAAAWQVVGLFRSLRMHEIRGGSRGGTVFGWIGLLFLVGGTAGVSFNSLIPAGREMVNILRGDRGFGQLEIRLLPSGHEVEIKGGIQAGSAAEFREFIKRIPEATVLHIDSYGGRMQEAFEMADIVAQRSMTTFVAGQCMSAATVIFVAGKERCAHRSAVFGFHSVSFPGMSAADLAKHNGDVAKRMKAAGVSSGFIQQAGHTPSSEMWTPSMKELVEAGVVQRITNGERFGLSSKLLAAVDEMEDELLSLDAYKNLKAFDPAAYDQIVRLMRETAATGASQAEVSAKMQVEIVASLKEAMPFASDQALVRMFDHNLRVADTFVTAHPLEVYSYLMGIPKAADAVNLTTLPEYPTKEDLAVVEEIFGSAAGRPARPSDRERMTKSLQLVIERISVLDPEAIDAFADSENFAEHPTRSVRALILYLKTIRDTLPPSQVAEILRAPD